MIVLLAPEGRLDCVVQGGQKSKRWGALIEPLSLLEGQFSRGKTFLYLREATMLSGFQEIREDLDLLNVAGYWIDLCGSLIQAQQDSTLLFRALVWALKVLGDGAPLASVNFWLELRLLASLGLSPGLGDCIHCGEAEVCFWDSEGGGLTCSACRPAHAFPLAPLSIAVLRALSRCPAESLQELHLGSQERQEIFAALRGHLRRQVGESTRVYQSHPELGTLLCGPERSVS